MKKMKTCFEQMFIFSSYFISNHISPWETSSNWFVMLRVHAIHSLSSAVQLLDMSWRFNSKAGIGWVGGHREGLKPHLSYRKKLWPRLTVAPLGVPTLVDLNCTLKGQRMTGDRSAPKWTINSLGDIFSDFLLWIFFHTTLWKKKTLNAGRLLLRRITPWI